MSKDELQTIAQMDTPQNITVPAGWQGLIVWAVGRFGVGIILAVVLGFATVTIYDDSRTDRAQLLEAYNRSTAVLSEVTKTLEDVARQVETNTRAVENISRK